jgi:hypothetical protein
MIAMSRLLIVLSCLVTVVPVIFLFFVPSFDYCFVALDVVRLLAVNSFFAANSNPNPNLNLNPNSNPNP